MVVGQSVPGSIDTSQTESKLKCLLKDKITQERKYPEQSANFSSSLKAQKKSSVETIAKNYKNVNYQSLHKAFKHALTYN